MGGQIPAKQHVEVVSVQVVPNFRNDINHSLKWGGQSLGYEFLVGESDPLMG